MATICPICNSSYLSFEEYYRIYLCWTHSTCYPIYVHNDNKREYKVSVYSLLPPLNSGKRAIIFVLKDIIEINWIFIMSHKDSTQRIVDADVRGKVFSFCMCEVEILFIIA